MIFGKTNVPLRLFYDIPDYTTDKGVKAEVYSGGTTSGGSSLLQTVTLPHNAGIPGRYEAMYTPPDGVGDLLSVRYVIYTDTNYTDKFIGYGVGSEQIVLNSGVGQLGGGGSFGITTRNVTDIAEKVWQYDISKITVKNSAAVWLKRDISKVIDEKNKAVISLLDGVSKKLSVGDAKNEILKKFIEQVRNDVLTQSKKELAVFKQLGDTIENDKKFIEDTLSSAAGIITAEQKKLLQEYLNDKVAKMTIDILSDFQRQFVQRVVVALSEVMALNYGNIKLQWEGRK